MKDKILIKGKDNTEIKGKIVKLPPNEIIIKIKNKYYHIPRRMYLLLF